jgi:hypothetical protein
MTELSIDVRYKAGHSRKEPWEHTAFFCLSCGKPSVWCKRDGGDYYAGESYLCDECGAGWSLPNEPDSNVDYLKTQRLEALRLHR